MNCRRHHRRYRLHQHHHQHYHPPTPPTLPPLTTTTTIIIIIIIVHQQLDLDRPVSASSKIPFKGLPSRLLPFGSQLSIIFGIQVLFLPVTCRGQFDLCLLIFSSTGITFSLSKICFLLWSKTVYRQLFWKISSQLLPVFFLSFFSPRVQISLSYSH